MIRRPRLAALRDMPPSPFAAILAELVARVPGAFAAALVDSEGECVDYAGRAAPYDLKVAAAHWHLVHADAARRLLLLGRTETLLVRGARRSFLIHGLPDNYVMVLLLTRRAGFTASRRALDLCERALSAEASWPVRPGPHWYPIRAECRRRTPVRIAAELSGATGRSAPRMHAVEVLGAVVAPASRERGYRVQLDTGAELTIVREAGGFWYADEPIPAVSARK